MPPINFKISTMKTTIIILLLLSSITFFSQDSCVVKVFPNDCLNCYVGMVHIENLDQNVKKTMVFPDLTKAEIKAYSKKVLNISDINQYHIIASDSVYNSLNKNMTSEVYLFKNGQLKEHFLLKTYCPVKETGAIEIKLPDSIAISNAAILSCNENFFFISDYTFSDCILINKQDQKIVVVTGQNLTSEINFNKIAGDTTTYFMFNKFREDLKSANMDRLKIEPSFGTKNEMTSFLLAPDIREENDELSLYYKTGVIIFKDPDNYKILHIVEESIPEKYVVYPGSFSKSNEIYYIQLIAKDVENDDQYILGKFLLKNESLIFSEFCNYKLPLEYLPAGKTKSLRKILTFANPFVFFQYSLSYYNIDSGQTQQLPLDSVNLEVNLSGLNASSFKLKSNFMVIDALITSRAIKLLYKKADKYYIAHVDRNDSSLLENHEITLPIESLKTFPFFYTTDKLCYLSLDNTIVVEKINYKN